jgi:ankyrin repeat protein
LGADPNIKDSDGKAPLDLAIQIENEDTMLFLTKDKNETTNDQNSLQDTGNDGAFVKYNNSSQMTGILSKGSVHLTV